jgi:transcriptional regulator with XRE-family HTH domain
MLNSKQINKISNLKSKGLSEREISKKLGISRNTLSKYSNPNIVKQVLQRNEQQAEKIETIKEEIKETRQDSKAIRKQLKRVRSQQERTEDKYYHLQEEESNGEKTDIQRMVEDFHEDMKKERMDRYDGKWNSQRAKERQQELQNKKVWIINGETFIA